MSGLRILAATLFALGATVAVFTGVVATDQLYAHGSVNHGRLIVWLIGGGIYTMLVGVVCAILDTGHWQHYMELHRR